MLVALCSVSIADALGEQTQLAPRIKWPNDIMLNDHKLGGLLAEVASHADARGTVVGIGLNVNLDPVDAGLPATATSLSHEGGRAWSRPALLGAIVSQIDRTYSLQPGEIVHSVWPRWERLLWRRRQRVRVDTSDDILHGIVEGLAPSGALRIRRDNGRMVEVNVGDVLAP
jgi:BirA family biotin operon repressor/biotin-[acetyl-CoA-carboxylase] ligase